MSVTLILRYCYLFPVLFETENSEIPENILALYLIYWLQNSLYIADIISNMWFRNNFWYGKFELISRQRSDDFPKADPSLW